MQPAQKIMRGSQPAQNPATPQPQKTKQLVVKSAPAGGSNRTFVSAARGRDSNAPTCGPATPCRSFQVAIDNTDVGGEVVVLDAGGYGSFTVSHSVTVNGGGFYAGTTGSATNGVIVNAGPSDDVSLVGLTITSVNGSGTGIDFQGGAALHIENSVVNGFGTGINATANYCISGDVNGVASLNISNSFVRDNAINGIYLEIGGGRLLTLIDHTAVKGSGGDNVVNDSLEANGGTTDTTTCTGAGEDTTISNSAITGASNTGVRQTFSTDFGQVDIDHCVISGNGFKPGGFGSGVDNHATGGHIFVSNTLITNNNVGVAGSVDTLGNNNQTNNLSNGDFNATVIPAAQR